MGLIKKDKDKVSTRRPYRKLTIDEVEKRDARKAKIWATERFLKMAEKNPQLERDYIQRLLGVEIKDPDPVMQLKQELDRKLTEHALAQIEADPELKEQYARMRLEELVGGAKRTKRRPSDDDSEDGLMLGNSGSFLDQLEEVEAIKERLGAGGKSTIAELVNKDTLPYILQFISSMTGKGNGEHAATTPADNRTIICSVDGKLQELTIEQYKQLSAKGQIQPAAFLNIEQPKGQAPALNQPQQTQPVVVATPPNSPELPAILNNLDLTELGGYLELAPEQFVELLVSQSQAGMTQADLLISYLTQTSYDDISKLITPYKDNSKVGQYVQKLLSESGKTWTDTVLAKLKEVCGA